MKILFIRSHNPYFETSASANRYLGLLDGLLAQGANITLVITEGYNYFLEYKLKGRPSEKENLEIKYLIPTLNYNIWFRRINRYLLSGIFQHIINVRLNHFFKLDYDFIWLTFEKKILAAYYKNQSRIKGKTLMELNEFNDLHVNDVKLGNALQLRHAEAGNRIFLRALKGIDLLAVMTKTLIAHYKPLAKQEAIFFHLPMSVDMNRFLSVQEDVEFEKPYIAYTGTFNNQKDGVDILIKAFAKIADKFPSHKLYLAGFHHYDVPMQKELIANFKLKDRVIYIGVIEKDKIPGFIKNAEVLAMARPNSRQAQGGFPTKLGEYLATGNPVCVTSVGEIADYLCHNESAFMAKPDSVDSFAEALDHALSDKENAKKVGLHGFDVAKKSFNVEIQSQRLYVFLNNQMNNFRSEN
ncbi:MAG: glycosyltransferase [Salinivirgaceae bacterium]|nr:glycosyltransferase [Salinivirgaceae bacterium]